MKRRALLGTLASVAVAGCFGSGDEATPVPETSEPPAQSTTARPTTQSTTQQTTRSATPPEIRDLGVPVGEVDSPYDADGSVERVVWYPEQTDAPLQLTPDAETLSLPTDETTFALANDTDYEFSLNFYDWGLYKHVEGEWYYVTPQEIPEPLHVLRAGATHEWTFTVDNTQEPAHGGAGQDEATVAGLGGGEYAFEVSGWFHSGDHEHRTGLGARFSIDGDPLELTPPDDVSTTQDGETVTATIDGQDGSPTEALVVERVGEAGVPPGKPIHDYVAEQLVRPPVGAERAWLWDALALFADGVSTVRIESAVEFDRPRFDPERHHYFHLRGDYYEARVETVD